jgi:hypothetical protein
MYLHEAISAVIGRGAMTCADISRAVNHRGLYRRKDGKPVPPSQISARVNKYPALFEEDRSRSPRLVRVRKRP